MTNRSAIAGVATRALLLFVAVLWVVGVGEICDWGAYSGWWRASEIARIAVNAPVIREAQHELRDALRPGDTVIALNGQQPVTAEFWNRAARHARPGDLWRLRLARNGQLRDVEIRLGENGWQYTSVLAFVLSLPLAMLWLLQRWPIEPKHRDCAFLATGLFANLLLSLLLGHLPIAGQRWPGLFADFAATGQGLAFLAACHAIAATGPAFLLRVAWIRPGHQYTKRTRALLAAGSGIFGAAILAAGLGETFEVAELQLLVDSTSSLRLALAALAISGFIQRMDVQWRETGSPAKV